MHTGGLVQRLVSLAVAAALLGVASVGCQPGVPAAPPEPPPWEDASGHEVTFVAAAPDVELEVLDWGGDGPPLVFLPGLGNTAHAFDDFAPRFVDSFRVIAITRRGFGASSHPEAGYDIETLAADVTAVLDAMQLETVFLAGHSIAAGELTVLGSQQADRARGLVYLDTYCNIPGTEALSHALFVDPPEGMSQPVAPTEAETGTIEAYIDYVHRSRGVPIPEADIRARYAADGWDETLGLGFQPVLQAAMSMSMTCAEVQVPALAVIAYRDDISQEEPWRQDDTAGWPAQREFQRLYGDLVDMIVDRFPELIPSGRVEVVRGAHHWIFASHPDEVEHAMREFLR